MQRKSHTLRIARTLTAAHSIRALIRDGHPEYVVTADSWPAFIYPKTKGDINNVEEGLFHSAILLKVCWQPSHSLIKCHFTPP
jgi:hypothetical protein